MIYLDNAATTYPKPQQVMNAVSIALRKYGANPGRSGHDLSIMAAEEIYRCREKVAELFHAPGPECVVFTLNCTQAANMVLKGFLKPGDHVVTSCLEHNAVMRPLHVLEEKGVTFTQAQVQIGDNDATVDAFRKALRPNTRMIFCTHASNVWGIRLPIERIAALAKQYEIPVAVDCAQSAGVLPIDMEDSGIDFLCIAGHKGLYGPMGTGILIVRDGSKLGTIIEGGTGTSSISYEQPETMPDRLESGTPNMPGISGLYAGINFVQKRGIEKIFQHEIRLMQILYDKLSEIDGVQLYTPRPNPAYSVPVLSLNIKGLSSETVGKYLNKRGIAVRPGLHCAPAAHNYMGTIQEGAVRVSPSVFNNGNEMNTLASFLKKLSQNKQ